MKSDGKLPEALTVEQEVKSDGKLPEAPTIEPEVKSDGKLPPEVSTPTQPAGKQEDHYNEKDDGEIEIDFIIEPFTIDIPTNEPLSSTPNQKNTRTWTSFFLRTAVGMVPVAGPAINATLSFMDGDYVGTVLNLGFAVADVYTLGLVGSASKLLEGAAQKVISEQATNIGVKVAADAAVSEAAKQAAAAAANAAAMQLAWETASKTLTAHAGKKVKKKVLKGLFASVASSYNAYTAAYQTAAALSSKAAEVAAKAGTDVLTQNAATAFAQNVAAGAGQVLSQSVAAVVVETGAKVATTALRSTESKEDDTVN